MTATAPTSRSRLPLALRLPMVADVGVVAATLAFALLDDDFGDQTTNLTAAFALDVGLCVPLLWRRQRPLLTFGATAAVALLEWWSDTPASGAVAVLVALYAVGAYESRRWAVAGAAATALLGVVMAAVRWAPPDHRPAVIVLLTGTVTAAWVMGVYARTRRAYVTSVLDRAATAERESAQQALLATAAERGRISREMHDIVAHTLSVMVALSDGAALSVNRDVDAARGAMEQSSMLGRQSLADLRRLLSGLQTDATSDRSPTPGLDQVPDLVSAVRAAGLAVRLDLVGAPTDVPPAVQLACYRLVQESLTNVLKHAPSATRATVTLRFDPSAVDLTVVNDGHDGGAADRRTTDGHGVVGMRERAGVLGGTLQAGPERTGGWRVAARLGYGDEEAGA